MGITVKSDYEDKLDPGFLYWQLAYLKSYLESIAPFAAQRNINLEILNRLQIWIPEDIEFQRKVNKRLDAVQQESGEMKQINQSQGELLTVLEQSVLSQAFRGEI